MAHTASATQSPAAQQPVIQRYFEVSLFLLVSTAVLTLVATGKLDLVSEILAPVALAYKGLRMARGRGPEISPRTATALVLAYFLIFPLDLWVFSRDLAASSPNPMLYAGLLAAVHVLLFATIVRLYSMRTIRDSIFLALLAFAAMLASAILTVNTLFLAALALFLLLAVSSFVGLEIRRSSEGAVSPSFGAGSGLARRLNRALAVTSAVVAASALLVGVLIFFVIPRFTAGYLSALNLRPTLMTGFTDNVTLGEIGEIKQSSAVVMRIRIQGNPSRAEEIHWRGGVLTDFDGKRWFNPNPDPHIIAPDPSGAYQLALSSLPPNSYFLLRYTVLMEPVATDAIFLASEPLTVWGHFGLDSRFGRSRNYLVLDETGTLFNQLQGGSPANYDAVSQVPLVPPNQLRDTPTTYPPDVSATYLQLPHLDPRIQQLALTLTSHDATPYDKAADLERYFHTSFRYTLDLSDMNQPDPLAYFLFNKRAGHCEYFASAMVVMLRTLGIPARYVTGFLPGEFNDLAQDYIIRASDAHSWVEVYFPGYGWITFDPTPPGSAKRGGLFSRVGMYWDWFQVSWNEWIINYDFSHQLSLARGVRQSSLSWSERVSNYYNRKRRGAVNLLKLWQTRLSASPYALPGCLIFLLALLIYFRGRALGGFFAIRWKLRSLREGQLPAELAVFEYLQMLRLLERRGWRKSPAQTPLEFAASIRVPEFAGPVAELTQLYQSARFGAAPADARRVTSLLQAIKEIRLTRKHARA
jgi:protein-glutamine gamma-glutamyltransferase